MVSTCEQVSIGHPDKTADAITSAVLDAYLARDPRTRYAVECQIKDQNVVLAGEVTSDVELPTLEIVKTVTDAIDRIGYNHEYASRWPAGSTLDSSKVQVMQFISKQSPDIAQGVDVDGWGDQGVFAGMATNDAFHGYMPLDLWYSRWICNRLYTQALIGKIPIGLDIKTQVSMDENFVTEVVVAAPMMPEDRMFAESCIRAAIAGIIPYGCGPDRVIINGTGSYVIHSSIGDCGTTGRKLAVDFYGLNCPIGGGCVDGETEYITPNGWKKISEYDGGLVGQIDCGMNLTFVKPNDYITTYHKDVYEFKTQHTIDMVLSGNHNVYYRTSKGNFIKKSVDEILKLSDKAIKGHHAEIPRYFYYGFKNEDKWNNEYLVRFIIAHCADGTNLSNENFNGRIRVKRQRKIDLLRFYLPKTGLKWEERSYSDGYAYFYYKLEDNCKLLCHHFNNPSMKTAKIICDEVFKWDGSFEEKEFRTTKKVDADFVQFVLSGMYGTPWSLITHKKNKDVKSTMYLVRNNTHMFSSPFRKSGNNSQRKLNPMTMYCFTVPTGLLLLRRNNYIFVTGNSPWSKDGTKADVALNLMARHLAVAAVKRNPDRNRVYVKCSCCIGRPEVRIAFFDENNRQFDERYENMPPSAVIEKFGLRKPIFFELCWDGLFSKVDAIK